MHKVKVVDFHHKKFQTLILNQKITKIPWSFGKSEEFNFDFLMKTWHLTFLNFDSWIYDLFRLNKLQ